MNFVTVITNIMDQYIIYPLCYKTEELIQDRMKTLNYNNVWSVNMKIATAYTFSTRMFMVPLNMSRAIEQDNSWHVRQYVT